MRILFFPDNDLMHRPFMQRIETTFFEIESLDRKDISNLIELDQIKEYLDKYYETLPIDEKIKLHIKENIDTLIDREKLLFINSIKENFVESFNNTPNEYQILFFTKIEQFKLHKYIQEIDFESVILKHEHLFWILIESEYYRKYFKSVFRKNIFDYTELSSELVKYIEETNKEKTITDIVSLQEVQNYISDKIISETLDIYTLQKLKKLRVSNNKLGIDEILMENIINQYDNISSNIDPMFSLYKAKKYVLSPKDIDLDNSVTSLVKIFKESFYFINNNGIFQLMSLPENIDNFWDMVGDHRSDEYRITPTFSFLHTASVEATALLAQEINKKTNLTIEDYIVEFYKNLILYNKINVVFSSSQDIKEKNSRICKQIESVLNQYFLYKKNGYINQDHLKYINPTKTLEEIKSYHLKKNIYPTEKFIDGYFGIQKYLFSKQSNGYIFIGDNKNFENLFDTILRGNIRFDELDELLISDFHFLIENRIIKIDSGFIRFDNWDLVHILFYIYHDKSITYNLLSNELKIVIDKMLEEGYFEYDNNLFSSHELKYLNYMLNNKEFINNLALRNKYSHSEVEISIDELSYDYYHLLKILILIGIKIYDDIQ